MFLIQQGNAYNVPLNKYYVESNDELNDIPESSPPGTIVEVNEKNNFHVVMKMSDGSWNEL